ncbi:hypothetical protein N7474_007325 [Penicillium riverlandense]|uniref:uncharacterized protein n=1 Tax=Penicillium riverlandense TaxID=1903569 RepID=UPI002547D0AA|nr:uncharacterized protein N7474_007325 [Penicillium riverlandense]KAJ5815548.1 hypothetical protein N7474_007325 [Penicillium riverlandense]
MGVPFEALLPYGIIVGMFTATGVGLHFVKRFANDGKKARWNQDLWDRVSLSLSTAQNTNHATTRSSVMERDLRITGSLRGQSSNHQAPKGFEVSHPWKVRKTLVEKRIY